MICRAWSFAMRGPAFGISLATRTLSRHYCVTGRLSTLRVAGAMTRLHEGSLWYRDEFRGSLRERSSRIIVVVDIADESHIAVPVSVDGSRGEPG
jgi:phage terminase large subunit-like protein